MDAVSTMITNVNTQLQAFTAPLGILGLLLWGTAFLLTPLLPEWAQEQRGYFKKALLVLGFMGFIPSLVAAFAAMGGAA